MGFTAFVLILFFAGMFWMGLGRGNPVLVICGAGGLVASFLLLAR